MTDLNKEREDFEQHLIDTGLVEFAGYGFDVDECDEYTHEPTNVAWGTWVIGLNRAKAQAVPEGYCLLPKELPDDLNDQIWDEYLTPLVFNGCDEIGCISCEDIDLDRLYQKIVKASESGAEG